MLKIKHIHTLFKGQLGSFLLSRHLNSNSCLLNIAFVTVFLYLQLRTAVNQMQAVTYFVTAEILVVSFKKKKVVRQWQGALNLIYAAINKLRPSGIAEPKSVFDHLFCALLTPPKNSSGCSKVALSITKGCG